MIHTEAVTIEHLEEQERHLILTRFTAEDAWTLGTLIRERVSTHPVVINIRKPHATMFHSSLGGAVPDNEAWVQRKSATVFRFEASSLLTRLRLEAWGVTDGGEGWFNPQELVLAGGSVPIRVAGVGVVAAATVSGLEEAEDHGAVVGALEMLIARQEGGA